MKKEIVSIPGVKPVSHLSRAVKFGDMVFVAGLTGKDLRTGEMPDDITGQSRVVMESIKLALETAGASMADILKTTCYLAKIEDKPAFDRVYISYFPSDPPARACFAVGDLGPGVLVEVETVAGIQR